MLDPYAGTGSVLVAAAAFGAQVMGADIDVRVSVGVEVRVEVIVGGAVSWPAGCCCILPSKHTSYRESFQLPV